MADKENEEIEKDKKLSDSSKSFAGLIGKTPIAPISFTAPASEPSVTPVGAPAPFSFKPAESAKLAEKDANSVASPPQTSLFKFGAASAISTGTANKPLLSASSSESKFLRQSLLTCFGFLLTADIIIADICILFISLLKSY